jgi:hypothetical protein
MVKKPNKTSNKKKGRYNLKGGTKRLRKKQKGGTKRLRKKQKGGTKKLRKSKRKNKSRKGGSGPGFRIQKKTLPKKKEIGELTFDMAHGSEWSAYQDKLSIFNNLKKTYPNETSKTINSLTNQVFTNMLYDPKEFQFKEESKNSKDQRESELIAIPPKDEKNKRSTIPYTFIPSPPQLPYPYIKESNRVLRSKQPIDNSQYQRSPPHSPDGSTYHEFPDDELSFSLAHGEEELTKKSPQKEVPKNTRKKKKHHPSTNPYNDLKVGGPNDMSIMERLTKSKIPFPENVSSSSSGDDNIELHNGSVFKR